MYKKQVLGLQKYEYEGKTYFSVIAQLRDSRGNVKKKSTRFTKDGNRISSEKIGKKIRFELQKELENLTGYTSIHTWKTWQIKAIKEMRRNGLKESTTETYQKTLNKWLPDSWKNKELGAITRDNAYELIHEYLDSKMVTDWVRKKIYKSICRLFEMAVESGEIDKNPARGIKVHSPPSSGKVLTPDEIQTLLEKANLVNHPYYCHWVLALMTGMRCGELYALSWNNIDFNAGVIRVVEQFTGRDGLHLPKKGKTRPIDLSANLIAFLHELKRKHGIAKENLWSWEFQNQLITEKINNKLPSEKQYKKVKVKNYTYRDNLVLPRVRSWRMGNQAKELKDFCKKIGITDVKFHDLRASHITNLLNNGVAISKVMKQVGHSKMSTTDAYHRFTGVEIKGVTDKLSFSPPKK